MDLICPLWAIDAEKKVCIRRILPEKEKEIPSEKGQAQEVP